MSTLTERPRPGATPRDAIEAWLGRLTLGADARLGLLVAALLSAAAFVTSGGVNLATNTWTEIVITILGAAAAIAVLLIGARGRRWGLGAFGCFAALTVLTAVSVLWSVQPATPTDRQATSSARRFTGRQP